MGKLVFWIIVILMLALVPIIPYEHELQDGVTTIENKTVTTYIYEQYKQTQERKQNVDTNKRGGSPSGSQ